ncbi:MAG TPA: sigma 54-interacting transcriptional regulator [Pyrinomonadaceae bacterium]|jgi:predicted ATPase/transcriptional regulator with GAF, ATPase, and Fis domain/tRNA A-37 threonylcarbamoyl transferase component Bud32|nr:sigma 54-interacting transcriptional regulator [Pyrinomonadaceae bacterium]
MYSPSYQSIQEVCKNSWHVVHRVSNVRGERFLLKSPRPGVLEELASEKLHREYETFKQLDVVGVPRYLEILNLHSGNALLLEDIEGISLSDRLKRGPLSLLDVLRLSLRLVDTLSKLHRLHLIHGNLCPHSILLGHTPDDVYLINYNFPAISEQSDQFLSARILIEDLRYIAPEQSGRINRAMDYRADFYSLGATLYEMLAGRPPFTADDNLELIHSHIARQPRTPSEVQETIPPIVSEIVMRLLAKNADERYQSAVGLRIDLQKCFDDYTSGRDPQSFALAAGDTPDRFIVPQTLFGRDTELQTLVDGFEKACNGSAVITTVSGPPGIGKTSLIQELRKPIVRQRAYLGTGKCDQAVREVPFGILLQALRAVAQQLITESEERIAYWRHRLLDSLGPNVALIAQVIPEIEKIVGRQTIPSVLAATEAQNRFQLVLQQFVRCIARKEHPLVLILEDLQWSDTASLTALQRLLESDLQFLYVIGSYRDSEVDDIHSLTELLKNIDVSSGKLNTIRLDPLTLSGVTDLVQAIIHAERDTSASLANIVLDKTAGNPFFVTEFMKHLHDEGLIRFDDQTLSWSFELKRIVESDVTENVIALMVKKIEKLDARTQELLKRAALIGNSFDVEVLAWATGQLPEELRDDLQAAIREGLVVPGSSYSRPDDLSASVTVYRFAHDELHRACYNIMPPEQRTEVHLSIGRLMRDNWGPEAEGGRIFEVVHQLNLCRHLISTESERLNLIRLNLIAGRKAKASTAFQTALDYFSLSRNDLAPEDWLTNYELCFEVNIEAAECSYLCGDFAAAETLLETLLERAENSLDKAKVYSLRIVEYENLIRYTDALQSGRQALALFGFLLPDSVQKSQAALEVEIESIHALLGERAIESLIESKSINDPEIRMVMNLLTAMWPSAYLTGDVVLTRLLSAIMVRLSLVYGHCEESAYGYVTHAITVGPVRGDYKSAYEFGKLALRVNERFHDSKRKAKIYQQFQAHVNLWRRPLQTCISYAKEARRAGLETGDFTYANYGAFTETWPALLSTNDLQKFVSDYSENLEFIQKLRLTNFADAQLLLLNWARALIGETAQSASLSTELFDELEYAQKYRGNPFFMNFYHLAKVQLGFHFGKYDEALEHASNADWIVSPLVGTVWPAVWAFWRGLVLAVTCTPAKAPQETVEELERLKDYLVRLADNCAENFRCHSLLLSAEIERIAGRTLAASDLYEQAISFARETDSLQNLAFANERYAAFWHVRQHRVIAAGFLQEAVESYSTLGAKAKANYLQELYGGGSVSSLFTAPATTELPSNSSVDLDIATALKAAGAISGEMDLDRLLARLVSIVIENAGAERGSLILEKNGEPFIQSEGNSENVDVSREHGLALEEASHLPRSIVHYVRRTQETVVLNDASSDDRFAADPYIQERQPRAVMCIPILKQAELIGVMYLENNLTANAFTPGRTQLVELLASEAAISLENATLYEEMKREMLQRKLAEETLRSITEGTANVTGADFFYSLVRHLATALRVRYAFVTKCIGSDRSRVRTLAFWNGEGFAENIEYDLEPTPCCNVIAGETCHYPDSLQQLYPRDTDLVTLNAHSFFGVPLLNSTGQVLGHLAALDDKPMPENPSEFPILKIFAARAGAELERLKADEELKSALAEVEALKNRLQAENIYLQEELSQEHPFTEIVGNSPPLLRMLADVERIAATSATVLIIGETGTGKELLARAIHNGSNRRERALVKVNCGAISAGLVESELFGHVKGAFTGAINNRVGRFELADGGTLFLDEISELPPDTQVKLLRVLQEGEFEPVGSSRTVHVDVRIIAASNRNLEDEIKAGRFRADLFYRLNVLPLQVPSLRERASDIPQLVMFFISKFSKKFGKNVLAVSQDTMRLLTSYSWPGNIRELQNIVERAVVLSDGTQLQIGEEVFSGPSANGSGVDPRGQIEPAEINNLPAVGGSLQDIERAHIVAVLDQVNWVIEGPRGAARILNLHPNTLRSRMKKLSIQRAHGIS